MRALTNFEIDAYYKGVKQYGGCYSRDLLPKLQNKCYVINMQDSDDGDGSHWLAVLNVHPHETVYFDSFGQDDAPVDVEKFLKQSKKKIVRSTLDIQSIQTDSCGQFCIYMINHALQGLNFKNTMKHFTHNMAINEQLLQEYFGQESFTTPALKKSIARQQIDGAGVREVIKYIKSRAMRGYDTIKQAVTGPREHAGPVLRRFLAESGNMEIIAIRVCRLPIVRAIEKLANVLSFGQYERNKAALSYDRLFHLFLLIHLKGGNIIRLEKNHVVEVSKSPWDVPLAEFLPIIITGGITVNSLITNAEKAVGTKALYVYDPTSTNCQHFCHSVLSASGLSTTDSYKFIAQDAETVLKGLGLLQIIARGATNIAGRADVLINGKGIKNRKKRTKAV